MLGEKSFKDTTLDSSGHLIICPEQVPVEPEPEWSSIEGYHKSDATGWPVEAEKDISLSCPCLSGWMIDVPFSWTSTEYHPP